MKRVVSIAYSPGYYRPCNEAGHSLLGNHRPSLSNRGFRSHLSPSLGVLPIGTVSRIISTVRKWWKRRRERETHVTKSKDCARTPSPNDTSNSPHSKDAPPSQSSPTPHPTPPVSRVLPYTSHIAHQNQRFSLERQQRIAYLNCVHRNSCPNTAFSRSFILLIASCSTVLMFANTSAACIPNKLPVKVENRPPSAMVTICCASTLTPPYPISICVKEEREKREG